MGLEVRTTLPETALAVDQAVVEGLSAAGKEILAASDALAPTEPEPRHGVHMIETGFTRVEPGADQVSVVIGYEAFWAPWQNENLTYDHPHGGQAKFLDTALVTGAPVAFETVAEAVRRVLG